MRTFQPSSEPSVEYQKAFPSRSHVMAMEQIGAALQRGERFVVATGAPGAGKTTLCLALRQVADDRTFVATLFDPRVKPEQLAGGVLRELGLIAHSQVSSTDADRESLLTTATRFFSSLRLLGARAVVVIDDAEQLSTEAVIELGKLSEAPEGEPTPVSFVLVGRASVDTVLKRSELQVIDRAVTTRVRLTALTPDEVLPYVLHRRSARADLGAASASDVDLATTRMLTPTVIERMCEQTGGIPSLVNDQVAQLLDARFIDEGRTMATDTGHAVPVTTTSWTSRLLVPALIAVTVGVGLAIWSRSGRGNSPTTPVAARTQTPVSPDRPTAPRSTSAPVVAPVSSVSPPATPAHTAASASPQASPSIAVPVPSVAEPAPEVAAAAERRSNERRDSSSTEAPAAQARTEQPIGTAGQALRPTGGYRITVASFLSPERAVDAVATIKALQLGSDVVILREGKWHRVVAGPFQVLDQAQAAQRSLALTDFPDTVLSPPAGRLSR